MSEHDEIVLVDEDGVEHTFFLYRIVEVDGRAYALLEPAEDEGELVILRVEGDFETGNLVTLADDEWDRVAEALDGQELFDEDFDEVEFDEDEGDDEGDDG